MPRAWSAHGPPSSCCPGAAGTPSWSKAVNRRRRDHGGPTHPPAQGYALLAGVFLAALGVLTLIFGSVSFGSAGGDPAEFLIWKASGWNTILWMAMGGFGIFASTRVDLARTWSILAAVVFGVLAVWGFIDGGTATMGIFEIGTAGNVMHAILAGLGVLVALMPESVQRRAGVGGSAGAGA
jgi:hypothetical protein